MKPRLWPAVLIIAAGGAWIGVTWLREDVIRQQQVLTTVITLAAVVGALVLWLLLFSRAPWRVRWAGALVVAVPAVLGPLLFRIHGVTGDLVPILEPRWRTRPDGAPPAVPLPPTTIAATPPTAGSLPSVPLTGRVAPSPAGLPDVAPTLAPTESPVGSYPQFQGPARNATLPAPRLARDWSARPPRLLWRQGMGESWSGFAVVDGLAITQEQRGGEERVTAYDARTGRLVWSHADAARYETVIAGIGPRSTPSVADGRVFTMGARGLLNALEQSTGRRLWMRDVIQEHGAKLPEWGKSCSPLVADGQVIVTAGGASGRSLVAYDAARGSLIWAAGSDPANYSSPALLTLAGRRQVVMLNQASVAGHDVHTGALLWQHPFPAGQPNVALPLPLPGDRFLVSAGYGIGSKAYRVAPGRAGAFEATLDWESPRLKSKFANLVWHDGSVYGLDDGVLTCLDPATGERRWKGGRYGHGQMLLVAGLLLVQSEEGEIVLVEPRPDEHRELTRFAALDGKTWNPPALAGRVLFVRNEREAAAYELPIE